MNTLSNESRYIQPDWNAPANVQAFVSTRPASPVGPSMADQHQPDFLQRRKEWLSSWGEELVKQWGWSAQPCWAKQVHGVDIIPASSPFGTEADAVWTDEVSRPCTVLTADCLPVLFCNRSGTRVAASHAGWRGLAAGVLESTVEQFDEAGEELIAWFGPAIGPKCFEVGSEVREAFIKALPEAEEAFVIGEKDRWFGDLYLLARQRLARLGITEISGGDRCTGLEEKVFHSYRRDGAASGRMVSAIWLTS
ncbi:peptidoglycan editing factor PgeF [Sansalvadorimonas verongulae]|uniref:peptidoglycan editing factor PgeF n=1 Tax=Sansalvadorimonas verongulae TaxID=2172824 RepID=UPI0012BC9CFE|nr:peptidoglycan editing factor PgeF [Sansalvadorimonas verongulae]MTI15228.1 peptidoglycan editing factor PgeF [Sansalvadorimonas verongulae]